MQWIAPSEKDTANAALKRRHRDAADQFRANSGIKSQEYSAPVLGLIFLRFAEVRFAAQRAKREKSATSSRRGSRLDEPAAYHAEGILYLPAEARFDYLLNRPEAENIGAKVNAAMRDIEKHNPQLACGRTKCELRSPNCEVQSVRQSKFVIRISPIPASLDYDAFGRIYEYFLGEFVMSERDHRDGCPKGESVGQRESILPPQQPRPPSHRSHRTLPRAHPQPRVRFGRHVQCLRPF
jgi:type I restriction enzyme M protein